MPSRFSEYATKLVLLESNGLDPRRMRNLIERKKVDLKREVAKKRYQFCPVAMPIAWRVEILRKAETREVCMSRGSWILASRTKESALGSMRAMLQLRKSCLIDHCTVLAYAPLPG